MGNRVKTYFVAGMALAASLTACDDIKESDRYIEVPAAKVERTVLLEDFTGQNCTNCPAATAPSKRLRSSMASTLWR